MNDILRYAIYPALAIVFGGLINNYIAKHPVKKTWNMVWTVLVITACLWSVVSMILMSIKFYKIPKDAVLHKKDIVDIFTYLFNCQIIFFLIVGAICFFVLKKRTDHNQDQSGAQDTASPVQVKEGAEK